MHKEIIKFWGKFLFIFPYGCIKNLKIRSKRAKLGNQNLSRTWRRLYPQRNPYLT